MTDKKLLAILKTIFVVYVFVVAVILGNSIRAFAQNATNPPSNDNPFEACLTLHNIIANMSGTDYTSNLFQYKTIFHCDQIAPWLKVPPPKK